MRPFGKFYAEGIVVLRRKHQRLLHRGKPQGSSHIEGGGVPEKISKFSDKTDHITNITIGSLRLHRCDYSFPGVCTFSLYNIPR